MTQKPFTLKHCLQRHSSSKKFVTEASEAPAQSPNRFRLRTLALHRWVVAHRAEASLEDSATGGTVPSKSLCLCRRDASNSLRPKASPGAFQSSRRRAKEEGLRMQTARQGATNGPLEHGLSRVRLQNLSQHGKQSKLSMGSRGEAGEAGEAWSVRKVGLHLPSSAWST